MKLLVCRSKCGPVCKGLTEATFEAVDFLRFITHQLCPGLTEATYEAAIFYRHLCPGLTEATNEAAAKLAASYVAQSVLGTSGSSRHHLCPGLIGLHMKPPFFNVTCAQD